MTIEQQGMQLYVLLEFDYRYLMTILFKLFAFRLIHARFREQCAGIWYEYEGGRRRRRLTVRLQHRVCEGALQAEPPTLLG